VAPCAQSRGFISHDFLAHRMAPGSLPWGMQSLYNSTNASISRGMRHGNRVVEGTWNMEDSAREIRTGGVSARRDSVTHRPFRVPETVLPEGAVVEVPVTLGLQITVDRERLHR